MIAVQIWRRCLKLFQIEAEFDASTVSGWVVDELGKIPKEGDSFRFENLFVTVTSMDARRVQQIKVEIVPPTGESDKEMSA